jgi:signal transduction histidine kinase
MSDPAVAPRVLTISTSRNGGDSVELSISDSGPGVPADISARVFEPFFSTKPEGMGFGLTISRTIAEAHGGRLWLADRAPPGATFTLALPVRA